MHSRTRQQLNDFFETIPIRRGPNFGMGVPECPDESRNPDGRRAVARIEYVQIVAWAENGIARYPLHIAALGTNPLHRLVSKVPKPFW